MREEDTCMGISIVSPLPDRQLDWKRFRIRYFRRKLSGMVWQ
ncbi:MAG: hypothetical protein ACI4CZ_01585 [Hominisplanchenecus sp.]